MKGRLLSSSALAVLAVAVGVLSWSTLTVAWWLVILGGITAVAPFGVALMRGRIDVFEPIFLFSVCYALLFVVRPAFDLASSNGSSLWLGYQTAEGYPLALAAGLIGAVAFYFGYFFRLGARVAQRLPLPGGNWATSSLIVFTLGSVVLCGLLFVAFLLSNGGFSALGALFAGRSVISRQAQAASSGYLYTAPLWLGSIGLLILAIARRWWSAAGFCGLTLVTISQVESLAYGDRSWWLPIAASVMVLAYCRRGARPGVRTIGAVGLFVLLFGITVPRLYREADNRSQSLTQLIQQTASTPVEAVVSLFQGLDTAMVDDLAIEVQSVPSTYPYQNGSTYIEALTRPVPRSLWSGKPVEAEVLLMQNLLPDFASRRIVFYFSVFGEPYLNFGFIGVALFGVVFGIAWRSLFEWFRRAPLNPCVFAIYAASWPFLFVYIRGGVGVDYERQVILVLPMLLAMGFSLVRRGKVTAPGTKTNNAWVAAAGAES